MNVGSVTSAPQTAAIATYGKVQSAQKSAGKAALSLIKQTESIAKSLDPSKGGRVNIVA